MPILHAFPALSDNYIWLLHDAHEAWVVDPGEAAPVLQYLEAQGLHLSGVLLTHHHPDHTAGLTGLRERFAALPVYGPAHENLPEPVHRLHDGAVLSLLNQEVQVLHVPGHTLGHIAYHCPHWPKQPLLLSGDTLFSAGCGRLFEGTPAQMFHSLQRLAALPDTTLVCCTHEYTLSNLRFAQTVEPDNPAIAAHLQRCQRLREQNIPTLPSTLALEKTINPFLRCSEPTVQQAVSQRTGQPLNHPEAVFAALREWKNQFQ